MQLYGARLLLASELSSIKITHDQSSLLLVRPNAGKVSDWSLDENLWICYCSAACRAILIICLNLSFVLNPQAQRILGQVRSRFGRSVLQIPISSVDCTRPKNGVFEVNKLETKIDIIVGIVVQS